VTHHICIQQPQHQGAVMGEITSISVGSVESFPPLVHARIVTDELSRLLGLLNAACPDAAAVSFDFDGNLRVHIDVRSRGDVAVIETVLPTLGGGGMLYRLTLGATPHHPFHHRISALVAC
jgi:hypothetical protein